MNKTYYILQIFRGVEPQKLTGPFKTFEGMRKRAVKINEKNTEDSIFYVVHQDGSKPLVKAFRGSDMN